MKVTKEVLLLAIQKCLENARELFEEATILKDSRRYPRAYTLYHLSTEEIGKIFLIISFILSDNYSEQAVKKFSREFQQHKRKIKLSSKIKVIITSLFEGDLSNDIVEKFKYSEEYIDNLNDFKNLSLYTFIDNTSAFKPSDIIDSEEVIELIKKDAQVKLLGTEQFCSVAVSDLDKMIILTRCAF